MSHFNEHHVIMAGVRLPITDVMSAHMRQVMSTGAYEMPEYEILTETLRPDDRVLELGTGCGFLSTVAARACGDDAVLTVEANPAMQSTIRKTFQLNGVSPRLLMAAVSGDGGRRSIIPAHDFWSSRTVLDAGVEQSVESIAFTTLVDMHRPSVIVCDIEGAEGELTHLALPQHIRAILIEVHSEELDTSVARWLRRQGFRETRRHENVRAYERAGEVHAPLTQSEAQEF